MKTKALNGSSISKGIQEKIKTVYEGKGDEKMQEEIFKEYYKKKCHPSLKLSTNMGNIYTGSLYLCLMSLIADTNVDLVNKKILMFSYGSGLASAMFMIRVNGDVSSLRSKLNI
mmetsp:Transcript_39999/g.35688  ORF Transcript_39999/g.35688 Transcript_39999/m.35688 type:complete len:114 (-) Transcript_39999:469-810(-)